MQKVLQTISSIPSVISSFATKVVTTVYDALLAPPRYVWGAAGLLVSAGCVGIMLSRGFETALPNQWLLVIKDGKLKRSGIGLSSFVLPNETIVKFPSLVQKAEFNAINVTKEMQGIQIQGYAFWSVFREGEGPFKCYKYMQGGNANDNVRTMCESVIRNALANSSLDSVKRDRNLLKEAITKQLSPQLKGWGIWLETVQLTEVKICSKDLFEDLQAQFRQETHLSAQQKRLVTDEKLKQRQFESKLKKNRNDQQNQTRKLINDHGQQIKRLEEETKYLEQNNKLKIIKLKSQNQIAFQRLKKTFEGQKMRLISDLENKSKRKDIQIENIKKQIESDKLYDEISLKKYTIDATQKAYRKVKNIKELKVSRFSEEECTTQFSNLLPGLSR